MLRMYVHVSWMFYCAALDVSCFSIRSLEQYAKYYEHVYTAVVTDKDGQLICLRCEMGQRKPARV